MAADRPTVALVALSATGAMGQYVACLGEALAKKAEVLLVAPDVFEYPPQGWTPLAFPAGKARSRRALTQVDVPMARRVWRGILRARPDVVHVATGSEYAWTALWTRWARRERIPLVLTAHDPVTHSPGRIQGAIQAMGRKNARMAAGVHVMSKVFIPEVARWGVDESRIFHVPHGSFAPLFLRHRPPEQSRESAVLLFGRMEPYKGLKDLIEAMGHLPLETRLIVAGPGRIEDRDLGALAADPGRFELHNRRLTDAEAAALLGRSSVCAMPYVRATQSSLPLIAAGFAMGLVTSDTGGLPEAAEATGGFVFPVGDAKALARAIREAQDSPAIHPPELYFDAQAHQYLEMYQRLSVPQ